MNTATEFVLFDGAQLQEVGALPAVLELPGLCTLYADLGKAAEAIGPMLVHRSEAAEALARKLDAMDGVFATTHISCDGGMPRLQAHLQSLRYLHTLGGNRYFLRYADNRTALGLWQVLDTRKRSQLLGPASQWRVRNVSGKVIELQSAWQSDRDELLKIRPEQFAALLDQSRPGELMSATLALWVGEIPSYAARMAWSQRVYAWLQDSVQTRTPLAPLVNAAMWRSAGRALDDASFMQALREDEALGRPASILEWEPAEREPKP